MAALARRASARGRAAGAGQDVSCLGLWDLFWGFSLRWQPLQTGRTAAARGWPGLEVPAGTRGRSFPPSLSPSGVRFPGPGPAVAAAAAKPRVLWKALISPASRSGRAASPPCELPGRGDGPGRGGEAAMGAGTETETELAAILPE